MGSVYKIFICGINIFFLFSGLTFAYTLGDYYPLKQGNSWTYSVFEDGDSTKETITVEAKERIDNIEAIKIVYSYKRHDYYIIDFEGIKRYKEIKEDGESMVFKPPHIVFPANIELGESVETILKAEKFDCIDKEHMQYTGTTKILLESIEDVIVPAGEFKNCLKFSIMRKRKAENGNYDAEDSFLWLAPNIGKIKELCFYAEYNANIVSISVTLSKLISACIGGREIKTHKISK